MSRESAVFFRPGAILGAMANSARRWVAAAVLSVGSLGMADTALAAQADYVGRTPPTVPTDPKVLGQAETRDPTAAPGGTGTGTGATDPIPITGGDVAGLTLVGLAAIAGGSVLLRRGRRAPG